jgi:hypothetical protein
MNLPDQIARYMSLREPQTESLSVLHEISAGLDYKTAQLASVSSVASEKSLSAKPVEFDASSGDTIRISNGCRSRCWSSARAGAGIRSCRTTSR